VPFPWDQPLAALWALKDVPLGRKLFCATTMTTTCVGTYKNIFVQATTEIPFAYEAALWALEWKQ